jgi:ubiquinone/menaquinone biosynthesis C-methylase UbiE
MAANDSLGKDWQKSVSKHEHTHVVDIAWKFRNLKTSETEPVSSIINKLSHFDTIEAVDMGCGAARWDMALYRYLGDKLKLTCLDADGELLKNLSTYLSRHDIRNFSTRSSAADILPFIDNSLDCIFTFNTIQHYDVPLFLTESARVLKNGGYLFVYTRIREKNEKINREEYTLESLKKSINAMDSVAVESVVFFAYNRLAAFEQMHFHSKSQHDVANPFYTPEELRETIKEFSLNIEDVFKDQQVHWFDENVLFVIKKEQKTSVEYLKIAASSFRPPGMVV